MSARLRTPWFRTDAGVARRRDVQERSRWRTRLTPRSIILVRAETGEISPKSLASVVSSFQAVRLYLHLSCRIAQVLKGP